MEIARFRRSVPILLLKLRFLAWCDYLATPNDAKSIDVKSIGVKKVFGLQILLYDPAFRRLDKPDQFLHVIRPA